MPQKPTLTVKASILRMIGPEGVQGILQTSGIAAAGVGFLTVSEFWTPQVQGWRVFSGFRPQHAGLKQP